MLSLRVFEPVWLINFRVQVVMLVMWVKQADISPHECVSTYFDRFSNFFRHLQSSEPVVQCTSSCRTSCIPDYFQILDSGVILKIPSEAQ